MEISRFIIACIRTKTNVNSAHLVHEASIESKCFSDFNKIKQKYKHFNDCDNFSKLKFASKRI